MTLKFTPFLWIWRKKLPKYPHFDKTSSGGAKRRYSQKLKLSCQWQDTCDKNESFNHPWKFFFVFWAAEKGTNFKLQWNFAKIRWMFLLNHSFITHLMSFIAHQEFLWTKWIISFRINLFITSRRSQKTTKKVGHFCFWGKPASWCLLETWYIFWTNIGVYETGQDLVCPKIRWLGLPLEEWETFKYFVRRLSSLKVR